jgi:hypothetical protein
VILKFGITNGVLSVANRPLQKGVWVCYAFCGDVMPIISIANSFFSLSFGICCRIGILSMGLEMEVEFDKSCKIGLSPNTVLPSHRRCSNVVNGNTKRKPMRKDDRLSLK